MLSWKRLSTTLLAIGATTALGACGDNVTPGGNDGGDDDIDANVDETDGAVPDAEVPDAMLDTYSGTITVLEASVFGIPQLGQGIQVSSTFWKDSDTVQPVLDTSPGSPVGCKVYEYTPAEIGYLEVGLNEGAVSVTVDNANAPTPNPTIANCIHTPAGYICPDDPTCLGATPGASCLGGIINGVSDGAGGCVAGVFAFTDLDGTPFPGTMVDGRYVTFLGTGSALLPNGTSVPIVQRVSANTIVIPHPAATTTCPVAPIAVPDTVAHISMGGVGPQPVCVSGQGCPDPGMVDDDAVIAVTLTAGGGMHIPTFTSTFAAPNGTGDDFVPDTATQGILANLPATGAAFTVGCAGAGGTCGTGDGMVLAIETADGPLTGLQPYQMPSVVTKRVYVRCAALATSITIPANVSAYLQQSMTGATRIQSTLIRGELGGGGDGITSNVNVVAGHAIAAFKTVTQCNDGVDNDTDGNIDFPADTDCSSLNDNSEAPAAAH